MKKLILALISLVCVLFGTMVFVQPAGSTKEHLLGNTQQVPSSNQLTQHRSKNLNETLKLVHIFKDGTRLSVKLNKGVEVGWVAQDAKGKVDLRTVVGWMVKERQGKPTQMGVLKQSMRPGERIPRPNEQEIKQLMKALEENRKNQQQQWVAPIEQVKCYICRPDIYGNAKCEVVPCDSMAQMETM